MNSLFCCYLFLISLIGSSVGGSISGTQLNIFIISDGLDAYEPSPKNISVTTYRASTYQQWYFEFSISGSYNIRNVANGLYLEYGSSCNPYENLIVNRYTGLANQRFLRNDDQSISPVCDFNLILGTLYTTPAKGVFVPRTYRSLSKTFIAKEV